MNIKEYKIAVIGLGYVGLPLAVEFSKKYMTIGYDINSKRIDDLSNFIDHTLEIESVILSEVILDEKNWTKNSTKGLFITTDTESLKLCNIYIITVPTPIDINNKPNLTPLLLASELVSKVLKFGDIVIYESTVYPGLTEEQCVPILEKFSNLIYNVDFYCGYSPERINPGDKSHRISNILKITSGSTPEIALVVDQLYKSIIAAGTHLAPSIKVAEAAKVIENAQRDINIAFINELAKIFNKMDINTNDVLDAACTKWNFINFRPGLVGGHCIGVDPYYLAQKAQELGYHPEIILAGRRLNDGMGIYIANQLIKLMIKKDINIRNSNILILGITFKENCPDVRNTKVVDIINTLKDYDINLTVYDPLADITEVRREYGIACVQTLKNNDFKYDVVILAVAHNEFLKLNLRNFCKKVSIIYDIKGFLPKDSVDFFL